MVFIFFGFNFAIHLPLLIAILLLQGKCSSRGWGVVWSRNTEYLWLILYPILVLIHSVLAGVICELTGAIVRIIDLQSFCFRLFIRVSDDSGVCYCLCYFIDSATFYYANSI